MRISQDWVYCENQSTRLEFQEPLKVIFSEYPFWTNLLQVTTPL